MSRRDFVSEIESKRSRDRLHPVIAPGRIRVIRDSFERVKSEPELLRYFPVALAAILESFIRKAIQALIDGIPATLDSFLTSNFGKDQKFDLAILRAVVGKQITVGELVGHLIPVKSVESIDTAMSSVLGQPFLSLLRCVRDRWAVEIEGKPDEPIIQDLDPILASISGLYKQRHILAHEDAEGHSIAAEEVAAEIQAVAAFLDAAAELVSNTLHPNAPLTQSAMTQAAAESAHKVAQALGDQLVDLRKNLSPTMQLALDRSQETWVAYCETQAALEGLEFEGGSLQPMIEASAREALASARIADLKRVMQDIPDWPYSEE